MTKRSNSNTHTIELTTAQLVYIENALFVRSQNLIDIYTDSTATEDQRIRSHRMADDHAEIITKIRTTLRP